MIVRVVILAGWLAFCVFQTGPSGLFYGFLVFGIAAWAWYMIFDTWQRFAGAVGRAVSRSHVTNQTLNVFPQPDGNTGEKAMRGYPARDTTDDFAGMITYRKNT